ncbi:MAG: lipoprotein signal peptidase [Sphingobacteriales bacterium]|nr:MAG: lipoprotein signal peptidase [Sphingobacteriales bacterium]
MKLKHLVILIALIVIADQSLKIWIKTTFLYGEERNVLGTWFRLNFIENEGMAYGWKFGGAWGKLALTIFRLGAVIFGTWYLGRIVKKGYHKGFIICAGLIYAGALGNLIDSLFYGIIFDKGMFIEPISMTQIGYDGLAKFSSKGYASVLHGNVVDMLYFPIIQNKTLPNWVPVWGGERFTFFSAIFNIADASISIGVITLLLFQRKLFKHHLPEETVPSIETNTTVTDKTQVS